MKNYITRILTLALAALCLAACGDEADYISVHKAQRDYSFTQAGGTVFVTVASNTGFEVTADDEWIYTEIYPGGRNNNLRITAYANEMAEERRSVVRVTAAGVEPVEIAISQQAAEPFISPSVKAVTVTDSDTQFSVEVNANTDFEFVTPEWFSPNSETAPATGRHTYLFDIDNSAFDGERTATLTIRGTGGSQSVTASVSVTQMPAFETVTARWGEDDMIYIWNACNGRSKNLDIQLAALKALDFTGFDRMEHTDDGFRYTNGDGDALSVVMPAAAFKIATGTSNGNFNAEGVNGVARMQIGKSAAGTDKFCFKASRSGVLTIECNPPSSGTRTVKVQYGDGTAEFKTTWANRATLESIECLLPEGAEEMEISIWSPEAALNVFSISYTYNRPIVLP